MTKQPKNPKLTPTAAERIAAATSWSEGAKIVVEQTGDPTAKQLYQNYIMDAGIGQFEKQGLKWLAGSQKPKVILVPIFAHENIEAPFIAQYQRDDIAEIAQYFRGRPGSILFSATSKMTPVGKGLTLLHEAAHADADHKGKYSRDNPMGRWQEEVDVFQLEHRWMAAIGGNLYRNFVSAEVTRFLEEYDDLNGKGGDIPALAEGPQLDQAFGSPASEQENAVRRTTAWFEVVYRMFEQKYGPDQGRRDMIGLTRSYYASRTGRSYSQAIN